MEPTILDALALAVPSIAAYILVIKGIASVITNNLNTETWGNAGDALDWLASTNKKAKLTGKQEIDSLLEIAARAVPEKTIVGKILRILS